MPVWTPPGASASLPGAVAAARFAGATTSGAPTSGTFAKGDYVVDQAGTIWVCTVAGTPGTWLDVASGRELAYAEKLTDTTIPPTTPSDILAISFTAGTRPYEVSFWASATYLTSAPGHVTVWLTDASDVTIGFSQSYFPANNATDTCILRRRFAASAGAKSYKIRAHCSTGDTAAFGATTNLLPQMFQAVEL